MFSGARAASKPIRGRCQVIRVAAPEIVSAKQNGLQAESYSHWVVSEMTFHIGSKKRWWNNQRGGARLTTAIALMVGAALYEIFSSPFARWWFVGLIVGGVVVALVIRMQRGDGL